MEQQDLDNKEVQATEEQQTVEQADGAATDAVGSDEATPAVEEVAAEACDDNVTAETPAENTADGEQVEASPEETPAPVADPAEVDPILEALLFASGEPLGADRISEATGLEQAVIEESMRRIEAAYAEAGRGIELVQVADKYQLRTKACYARFIQALTAAKPRKLSAAALETLSIVAYRQPIVRSDIEKIRGVDATPTIKTLLEKKLIKIVGHAATVGQPALYGTTEEFLKLFGLSSLSQLPTLRDLNELEADPGETPEGGEEIEEHAQEATEDEAIEAADGAEGESEEAQQEEPPQSLMAQVEVIIEEPAVVECSGDEAESEEETPPGTQLIQ